MNAITPYNLASEFKKRHPKNKITIYEYRTLHSLFGKFLRDAVLSGEKTEIPYCGSLDIVGKDTIKYDEDGNIMKRFLMVDFGATNKLRKECPECDPVYHLNQHSSGKRYKFKWSLQRMKNVYKYIFKFKAAKTIKMNLAALIKNGKEYHDDNKRHFHRKNAVQDQTGLGTSRPE